MAIALARKYRPRDFASVAVQSHVSNTLKGAIARGRVAHGYLLCGPRGTGKTTLARVLAMALNCERRGERLDGEPCGVCQSCERIWSGGASLDVVEIDAASNRGVDDARDLRERAMYAPSSDERYKVYIVDEAHMLTREAWNALLKILEEPPPRVVFVFATTEPQKIAMTAAPVLSRLQRFDLKRIGPAEIRERLAEVLAAEGVEAEPEALAMIARAADGGLRDALSLTDQVLSLDSTGAVTADRVREALGLVAEDEFLAVLDVVAERRAPDVFATVARLVDAGIDLGGFLAGFADILRAQLATTLGGKVGDLSERTRSELVERRERLSAGDLLRMLHAVGELEPRLRRSGQQQLLLETLLVRLALMDRSVELESILEALEEESSPRRSDGGGKGSKASSSSPRRADVSSRAQESTRKPASRGETAPQPDATSPGGSIPARGQVSPPSSGPASSAPGDLPAGRPTSTPAGRTRGPADATMPNSTQASKVSDATAAPAPASAPAVRTPGPAAASTPVLVTTGAPSVVRDGPPPWEGPRPWDSDESPEDPPAAPASPSRRVTGTAGAAAGSRSVAAPEINHLVERWGEVADRLRAAGRGVLAALLMETLPVTVTANGSVTLEADDGTTAEGLENGREEVLSAVRGLFPGVARILVRHDARATGAPMQRLTVEGVREERVAALRRRDPTLAAAIETLDLELLD